MSNSYKLINASWPPNFVPFSLNSHGMKCINSAFRDEDPLFSVSR